ncbi:BTAD domain-containing putative transcriptional regulator [Actinocrispum sp. NPDC049592]|uniref:AfsR/SARP family transcriptional regulator n=1 Tax=Actinocrispum sp. NPDC049592 TaxID=3154835 RepID=UPI003434A392
MEVRFQLLGEVGVTIGGHPVRIHQQRLLSLLAVLLVEVNRTVPMDTLADRVWGEQLPRSPRQTLHTYVSRLRTALGDSDKVSVERHAGGYLLTADPDLVDLHRFQRRYEAARAATDDEAAVLLAEALGEWHGEAFATVDGEWLAARREALRRDRVAAQLAFHDIQLRRGRHAELVAPLTELAAADPLDERLAAQLIQALDGAGRRAEALEHYQTVRRELVDRLGVEPGAPLQDLHQRILRGDAPGTGQPVPRQLPADIAGFTGRQDYLRRLDTLLSAGHGPMVISSVAGMAGIGKTTLVVHWAHRAAAQFPDGQLYVNLRGFDATGSVVRPEEALRGFLDALGVSPQRLPTTLEAQAGLYRSLLADRRMLVLLDNARDAEQVRPLLPGSASCVVVITSRNQLTDLVATTNARPLTLELPGQDEAVQLLTERLGAQRVETDPGAVGEIVARCARLPLALAVVAARAAIRPDFPLAELATQLHDSPDLHSVFSWSVRALSPAAAEAFGLLGVHPDTDFSLAAATSMIGTNPAVARRLLRELCDANLLREHRPGRYTFHDLLRAYARTCTTNGEQARTRMLDHYLHTADHAASLFHPHRVELGLTPAQPGVVLTELADRVEAMTYLVTEYATLVAAVSVAYDNGMWRHCWQLAMVMANFQDRRALWLDQLAVLGIGLAAARQLDDDFALMHMHRNTGSANSRLGRYDEANHHLAIAAERAPTRAQQGHSELSILSSLLRQGRVAEALRHAEKAYELYSGTDRMDGTADSLNAIGWCHTKLGNHREALKWCEQALDLHIQLGARLSEADTLDSIGYAHSHLGDHAMAIECYQRALAIDRELGDITKQAEVLEHLGDVQLAIGDTGAARLAWEEAVAIWDVTKAPERESTLAKLAALETSAKPDNAVEIDQ